MQFLKTYFLFLLILLAGTDVSAQIKSIGTPFIHNYTRPNYRAGSQTWTIRQGNNGMMYFANNDGLLEFDGIYWNVYTLPNNSVLRSITTGSENRLFAGGFNEIGYYKIGKTGVDTYTSLTGLVPEADRNFKDVWRIYVHADGVIFQTYDQLMFYKEDSIQVIHAPSTFHFSFLVNNEYYVNDLEKGLMRYALGSLHPMVGTEKLRGKEIWGLLSMGNYLLVATASEGVFIYDGNSLTSWQTPSSRFLQENQIYSAMRLNSNLLAFGTIQNGLLLCDNDGNPLQYLNVEDGLQNNTILCINQDDLGNLWLGSDHGIDYLKINSPLSRLSNNYGLSTGYAAIVFNQMLYLGTNQGLFAKNLEKLSDAGFDHKELDLIEETRGQVWSLSEIGGALFCGHNNGTFLIRGSTAKRIAEVPGGWTFRQIPGDSSLVIGGNYSGLALYKNINGAWTFRKQLKGFSESARTIVFDSDRTLWIAHGYKGIFHVYFNDIYDSIVKVELYNEQNSELASSDVSLSKIDGEIVFTSAGGVFMFSQAENRFVPHAKLNNLLGGQQIRSLTQDNNKNIWYFGISQAGVLRFREDGIFSNIRLPFLQLNDRFVKGFEYVYPFDGRNVFFGAENGFIHYDPSINKNYSYPFRTYLRSMQTFKPDSVFHVNQKGADSIIELDYSNNNVEFLFSANDFENSDQILFSTFLEGYDNEWSAWQPRNTREFTNLYEGDYVFRVKAKNMYDSVTSEKNIHFSVKPPFHRSLIAFVLYGIVILIILMLFAYALKLRFERAKKRSQKAQEELFRKKEEEFQREALETEKQIIRMRNDKLREEMKTKDKELANATMQMLHKNEMLITLRDELKKLAALSNDETQKYEVKYLVRKINKEIDNENQWKIFETQFENVHEEFLKRLKTTYPDLTPRELKLCAYLRLNISSKEIAVLMNISVRGVEISRYRLRKKLKLKRETNLTDYILSY